jgi:CheY-like chemotaxis protein
MCLEKKTFVYLLPGQLFTTCRRGRPAFPATVHSDRHSDVTGKMEWGDNMKKLLIVDDQAGVRALVEVSLQVENYHIFQAKNGEEAREMARAEKPELIIMDVMVSGGPDGLEATRRIKNDPEIQDCTIVMLTAKGEQADRKAGLEAVIFPRKNKHGDTPQEGLFHIIGGLDNRSMNGLQTTRQTLDRL